MTARGRASRPAVSCAGAARRLLFCPLFCLLIGGAGALAAEPAALDLSVKRLQWMGVDMYQIDVGGAVRAPPATVWRVLTDYEQMSQFVPDLRSCRVLARDGDEVLVEQFGTARLLFLERSVHLVVRIRETPMSRIDIALVAGDMRRYNSRWELAATADGTRIAYRGQLVPDFYIPAVLGARLIRGDVERMLAAVLARIERVHAREGAGPAAPGAAQAR